MGIQREENKIESYRYESIEEIINDVNALGQHCDWRR